MITLEGIVKKFIGDGSTKTFSHNLKHTDFIVFVDGVQNDDVTKDELGITFSSAPSSGAVIELKRYVQLFPEKYEKYKTSVGAPTETRDDGIIEPNWEHQRGALLNYFLMAWEMATDDEVKPLWDMLAYAPTTSDPMVLTWEDGTKYRVVFADKAGEERCKFDESIIDEISGTTYWKGTVALIEIERL